MPKRDKLPIKAGPVTLRRLVMSDLPAFLAYRSDPDIARYQSWGETDEASARGLIECMADMTVPTPGAWCQVAVAGADDALLGDMGLHLSEDGTQAEIGITLSKNAQGSGAATMAVRAAIALLFQTASLNRIVAIADQRNTAAIKCMEASGFIFTHEADFTEDDGTITPEVHYEMNRP